MALSDKEIGMRVRNVRRKTDLLRINLQENFI